MDNIDTPCPFEIHTTVWLSQTSVRYVMQQYYISSMAAVFMFILPDGVSFEHKMPILITEAKQANALSSPSSSFSYGCICNRIGSMISDILSGYAISANKCRLNPSLNISSVGALPVNISSRVIPKL